jgi:hypothetical protein
MARRQIVPAFPSPGQHNPAMWYDFGISSTRKVRGADFDAKNTPGAGIECMLLAEPACHEGSLDEESKNRFRRCGNENRSTSGTPFIAASASVPFFRRPLQPPQSTIPERRKLGLQTGNRRLIGALETRGA